MSNTGDIPPTQTPANASTRLHVETLILGGGPQLLAYIRKIFPPAIRASYDPVDIYQTTVFEAFRRVATFEYVNDAATVGWLRLMARRQIGMALRQERRRGRTHSVEFADNPKAGKAAHLLAEYGQYLRTPSKSAMRHEVLRAVELAMESIPAHLRDAVRLRHIEGLPVAGVAERLGRTESAVATLCYRGLRLLARKLRWVQAL
jgi:RNA polymerase sigma-70 factor, ECF subfamily